MMVHKFLHQLLEEDQEPFHLSAYIAEKQLNLKRVLPKSDLQIKKRKPISSNSIFTGNFFAKPCFASFHPSPEFKKSPLFEFRSPARNNTPNSIFLHIPARTAALLLESALKIHKQKSIPKTKNTQIKNRGISRFGSVLKRLTLRNRNSGNGREASSCNGRSSYGFWSESNESMDLGTSCSSQSVETEETEERFCESPFRFVLQRSPSYGCRTPEFTSPAVSPRRRRKEDEPVNCAESLKKFQVEEDEEDKEQCSPVSVFDGPFDDGYNEGHVDPEKNGDGDEDYDLECSYAAVQRTKKQLLNKLRRFERLADLDPIELEKVMQEEEQDEKEYENFDDEECEHYNESVQWDTENDIEWLVKEVANDASFCKSQYFLPQDMRKLVADLIAEEEADRSNLDKREEAVKRVCKRLELWKEVELNTIDMMVEEDLRNEVCEWKKNQKQRREEVAKDLELAIFGMLVEELAVDMKWQNFWTITRSFY